MQGADCYRNPDQDLPADFDDRYANYYVGLGLAQDACVFVADVRTRLEEELHLLNATLAQNDRLRLRAAGENRISITPFTPQPEPVDLIELKNERGRSWPMTGLLDVLKETALDTQFLDCFESSASREALAHDVRNWRLLLTLYSTTTIGGITKACRISRSQTSTSREVKPS